MAKRLVRQCNTSRAQMVRPRQPHRAGEQVEADARNRPLRRLGKASARRPGVERAHGRPTPDLIVLLAVRRALARPPVRVPEIPAEDERHPVMRIARRAFELGIEVQVLRRGTLFAQRAKRLYELYREYPSLDALPAETRQKLELSLIHI